mmetsp:Transcript_24556/g.61334  ORF Transcript_24556/g.61334 Transcript_24556/m.61334 type:complete len:259 (+) Transcript_24556:1198-1974(+)
MRGGSDTSRDCAASIASNVSFRAMNAEPKTSARSDASRGDDIRTPACSSHGKMIWFSMSVTSDTKSSKTETHLPNLDARGPHSALNAASSWNRSATSRRTALCSTANTSSSMSEHAAYDVTGPPNSSRFEADATPRFSRDPPRTDLDRIRASTPPPFPSRDDFRATYRTLFDGPALASPSLSSDESPRGADTAGSSPLRFRGVVCPPVADRRSEFVFPAGLRSTTSGTTSGIGSASSPSRTDDPEPTTRADAPDLELG